MFFLCSEPDSQHAEDEPVSVLTALWLLFGFDLTPTLAYLYVLVLAVTGFSLYILRPAHLVAMSL